jgi:hypothetical protein
VPALAPPAPGRPPTPRHLLGPGAGAGDLAATVAAALGVPAAQVITARVRSHPYRRPALTTAGRYLVGGWARVGGDVRRYAFFVKVIRSYRRSPLSLVLPGGAPPDADTLVPWRIEAQVYRQGLRNRLPAGLDMPRAYAVRDLDADSAALWLERIPARRLTWDVPRHAHAAHLLGRLAASPAVASLEPAGHGTRSPRLYADTWLTPLVLPALADARLWAHPLLAGAFDPGLRARLRATAEALPDLLDELDDAPTGTAHGDACTANLLAATDRRALVLVDFGFFGRAPLGTDLGQLVLGEIQAGRRDPADLPGLAAACLPAYAAGVRAEGGRIDDRYLRRVHALLLAVFSALGSVPVEHLADEPTPALRRAVRSRAAAARFCLDLLDTTTPTTRSIRPSVRRTP